MNKKILGGVSVLAAGGIATGVYLAVPASAGAAQDTAVNAVPAAATAGAAQHPGRHPGRLARLRRAARGVHGQATVRTKNGFAQVSWQRGRLTGVSGSTLTVRSLDGTTWQWTANDKTRVRKDGQKSALSKLAAGDFVVVAGPDGSGGARTARIVVVPKKVPAKATESPAPAHT